MGQGQARQTQTKQNQQKKIDLLQPQENCPLPREIILQLSKSFCGVVYDDDRMIRGVLISLTTNSTTVYGFVSHCNELPSDITNVKLKFSDPDSNNQHTFPLDLNSVLCFTCPITEVVFIHLDHQLVDQLKQHNRVFYDLNQQVQSASNEDTVYLFSLPEINHEIEYASGCFKEYYGQDLVYSINCPFVSPGLPVISSSGQLLGIHKNIQIDTFIAISTTTVITTFRKLIDTLGTPATIISNPIDLTPYGSHLHENGLEPLSISGNKYEQCMFYVSPASPYITPIWFAPTYLGWYWSPTDPNGETQSNWMSVSRLEVIGGEWHGQIPAPRNVTIIRWLDQHNIVCGDCSL